MNNSILDRTREGDTCYLQVARHQPGNVLDRDRGRTNLGAEAIVEDDTVCVDLPNTVTSCGEQIRSSLGAPLGARAVVRTRKA